MSDKTQALAKAMREAGPACCNSTAAASEVLAQSGFDTLTPENRAVALARVLGLMVSKSAKSIAETSWDFHTFATALANNINSQGAVDWTLVIQALDYPEFAVQDAAGFEFIVKAFRTAAKVLNHLSAAA